MSELSIIAFFLTLALCDNETYHMCVEHGMKSMISLLALVSDQIDLQTLGMV